MFARNLHRFKVITFDCTNTLLYFKVLPSQMYKDTAIKMGHKSEDFDNNVDMMKSFRNHFKNMSKHHPNFGRKTIGYNLWWTILVTEVLSEASSNRINQNSCEKIASELIRKYETDECWAKFKKTDEILRAIKKEGKILGVISNFDPRLHNLLENMKLDEIDFAITSYEAGVQKPNAEIFEHALHRAIRRTYPSEFVPVPTIHPNEVLHIGNEREKDYEGAKSAGFSAVLINSENGDYKDIEDFYKAISSDVVDL